MLKSLISQQICPFENGKLNLAINEVKTVTLNPLVGLGSAGSQNFLQYFHQEEPGRPQCLNYF
jgi:hypothetical protein